MKSFKIHEKYLTSITVESPIVFYSENGDPVEGNSVGLDDHPKFIELREKLEKEKYIRVERSYWNGDTVIRPFTVNGIKFGVGEKFPCASALSVILSCKHEDKKQKSKNKK